MASPQQICNSVTRALISYLRRSGGEGAVSATLELAGETRSLEELCDPFKWGSYDQAHALFSAAVLVMNDPDIGRRAGENLISTHEQGGLQELLRSLSGPEEVIALAPTIVPRVSSLTTMDAVSVESESALVSARTDPSITRDRIFCGFTAGVLARLPWLYGMEVAEVTEIQCQTRGDERCLFKVAWDRSAGSDEDPDRRIAHLKRQVETLTSRIESLEVAAADLATSSDIDTLLKTIVMRASLAVRGFKYVLAVRLPQDDDLRVHHIGCSDAEARARATEILAKHSDEAATDRLIVEVASSRHHFGRLAVFYPEGYAFQPHEHRELRAYAGHAAAALETAAALDEARQRSEVLAATLALASSVAGATTAAEVATILAHESPTILDSERCCVILWEPADEIFIRVPNGEGALSEDSPAASDTSRLGRATLRAPHLAIHLARNPEPVVVSEHMHDHLLASVLELAGMGSAIIAPIVSKDLLLGMLVAGSSSPVLPPAMRNLQNTVLRSRVAGIASIAAPALKNARLMAELSYEALHDPLTTLPNTRLLQDEVVRALSHAQRQSHQAALLFVDIDHFEAVNDALGHVAADDVLRAVGMLLRTAVRRGDVVARLSGDQFAVLLPHVRGTSDAELVAEKIIGALAVPVDDFNRPISLSASVGVAVFPEHGASYDELLGHADAAMRQAKAAGGNRLALAKA